MMFNLLVTTGLACVVASIVGGGLKAFGIEIPALASRSRQVTLGILGLVLLATAAYNPAAPAEEAIFHTDNTDAVQHGPPRAPATFSISRPYFVTYIWTYHCFNYENPGVCGDAFAPGYISLKRDDGVEFGPWQVSANNNVERTNWGVRPNARIPSGIYTVTDSVPEHWSWNEKAQGRGLTKVYGQPVGWGIFGY
jgi:hypothetical protein